MSRPTLAGMSVSTSWCALIASARSAHFCCLRYSSAIAMCAAQARLRVIGAIELLRVPAAEARPPLGRELRIGGFGRDLRRLVDEVSPAAGRGSELLGARGGDIVFGRELARRRGG